MNGYQGGYPSDLPPGFPKPPGPPEEYYEEYYRQKEKEAREREKSLFEKEKELYREEAEQLRKLIQEQFGRRRRQELLNLLSRGLLTTSIGQEILAQLYAGEIGSLAEVEKRLNELLKEIEKKKELKKKIEETESWSTISSLAPLIGTAIGTIFGAPLVGLGIGQAVGQTGQALFGSQLAGYQSELERLDSIIANLRQFNIPIEESSSMPPLIEREEEIGYGLEV